MLQVKNLCVEVGARLVVNDASFTVMPRDKVGLVGRNGAGKTSLFKVLGGASEPSRARSPAVGRSAICRKTRASPVHSTVVRRCRTSCHHVASMKTSYGSRSCASRWKSAPTNRTSPASPRPKRHSNLRAATRPTVKPARLQQVLA
ncbi:MAG: ATP-binding cassette domain-containing protein [Actinobacteria bacterium]|nr:ATP-binding cassette domain-containing protein [Actinomycetota bacterium]